MCALRRSPAANWSVRGAVLLGGGGLIAAAIGLNSVRLYYLNLHLLNSVHPIRQDAERDPAYVRSLLRKGADPNLTNHEGVPLICLAARRGDLQSVTLLYEAGVSADGRGLLAQHYPLEYAAQGGHAEVADFLLRHGARVNHGIQLNSRALALAVKGGSARSVQLLLAAGAGPNSFDDEGRMAPDLAQRMGRKDLLRMLRAAGGKTTEEAKRVQRSPSSPAEAGVP